MPAADNIRSCREPSFLKTEASLNEIIWNGANPPLPQPAHAGSPLREGAIVCKGEKGRQCPAQLRCINMRCAPAGQAHPRETKARRPAEPKRHSQPKSAPAAQPPQPHLVDQTHPRETKDLNYRSQPDKPACARLRPKQPASGSGEPRKRLKLRSAMHNYVSCLGMTTYKVSANIRFHRTQRRQKALFFGGIPVSFGKTKEMGYKGRNGPNFSPETACRTPPHPRRRQNIHPAR